MPEVSEAMIDRDDMIRPLTPPNIATATDSDTSTQYHDWTNCTSEPGMPSELDVERLEICDGAEPEVLENPMGDNSVESNDSDSDSLELDSVLPIAEILASVLHVTTTKESGVKSYHFEGVPTAQEMGKFEAYVKRVRAFTLTKAALDGFPSGTVLRLSMMRNWQGAFFQSLKTLRVDYRYCDNSTMQALNLFLTPSLESLAIVFGDRWDDDFDKAHNSFVASLSSEARNLTCLYLIGSSRKRVVLPTTPNYCPFEHLRALHLEHVVIDSWSGLRALGALEPLEDLSLLIELRRTYHTRAPTSTDGGEWDVLSDCPPRNDTISFGFGRLQSLRVAAHITILRDLLGYIESDNLIDLSVTLLASSRGTESLQSFRKGMADKKASEPSDEQVIAMVKSGKARFTFRNEDEFFCLLLNRAVEKWQDLRAITIDYGQLPNTPYRAHILSVGTVKKLLRHSQLRRLKIFKWATDFDVGKLIAGHPATLKSNLQNLHLPTNALSYKTTEGIAWVTLSSINNQFPCLISFHGYLNRHISNIPDYTAAIPAEISPNYNLRTLALGDGPISWDDGIDSQYLLRVGVYLYSLFPHLKAIIAQDNNGSQSDWDHIKRLVKMCQASSRLGKPIQS